ncbi:MAG: ATP-binding cassette domain-containing protein [Bacteroidales bacterium]|nr:ATP-binding cassette domain-containing protein [Bacteroidales bacterium]
MEVNRNVFEIEGLECAYNHPGIRGKKVVLRIDHLAIPAGEVTIILGMSGSGKSTLIETLGLMNNTITKGRITFTHAGIKTDICREIWNRPSDLTEIRNSHFSFIFQHDFLMPYYSPEENILIGKLIQDPEESSPDENMELNKLCQKTGLNFHQINKKKTTELSVGQKQRLSFIRAIIKNYSVIFGDEPTGNLDEVNSALLLDILTDSIRQNKERSAILVSHNVRLSIAKAGYIIVLSPVSEEEYEVRSENVFKRKGTGWLSGCNDLLTDSELEAKIRNVVNISEQKITIP